MAVQFCDPIYAKLTLILMILSSLETQNYSIYAILLLVRGSRNNFVKQLGFYIPMPENFQLKNLTLLR